MEKPKKAKDLIAAIGIEAGIGILYVFVYVGIYFFVIIRDILIIICFPILVAIDAIQEKCKKDKKIKEEAKKYKAKSYWQESEKKVRNYLIYSDVILFACLSCVLPYSRFNLEQKNPNLIASIFVIILFVLWSLLLITIIVYIKKVNKKYRIKINEISNTTENNSKINQNK